MWVAAMDPLLKAVGSPGGWGYNTKLGLLAKCLREVREEISSIKTALDLEASEVQAERLRTAGTYWEWLRQHDRLTSFSAFVNEFGYQADDGKLVYESVVVPCIETFARITRGET